MEKSTKSGLTPTLEKWNNLLNTPKFIEKQRLFQEGLLNWFEKHARDLPWRKTRDPYRILLSELMLQQTQVDRVIDFYEKFLSRFPDFQSVANAEEAEILKYWEGLGYYNRARNLQKTAKEVQEEYEGKFPTKKEDVLALPGIGEYTAGAVMTFALNLREPIVDTNVNRVLGRVFLQKEKNLTEGDRNKILWRLSEWLLPFEKYWEFNQAIMDFGALHCKPEKPKCSSCPFRGFCTFYSSRSLGRFTKGIF